MNGTFEYTHGITTCKFKGKYPIFALHIYIGGQLDMLL